MVVLKQLKRFIQDTDGDAVVEATILFPIMIMIFAGIVLLAMYLPQEANLERAVQYAATSLMPEISDVGYEFSEDDLSVNWNFDLHNTIYDVFAGTYSVDNINVYEKMLIWVVSSAFGITDDSPGGRAEKVVNNAMNSSIMVRSAPIEVTCAVRRGLIYSDIEITATQIIDIPIDLSFVGFPDEIVISKRASCMVLDGDGFLRNADDAIALQNISSRLGDIWDFFSVFLDI